MINPSLIPFMPYVSYALFALIILLIILWYPYSLNNNKKQLIDNKQNENYITSSVTYPLYNPYAYTHTNFPFWNSQLGSKRNMSYDLRGDVPIPYYTLMPFNMSTRIPIKNKPLHLIS